ncbi:MAG: universal stress protein [Proteobacteria bacterium]|nr:universal stress protein [Pseudomonadota bacterium]
MDDALVEIMTSATSAGYTPVSLPIPEDVLKGVGEAIVRKAKEVAADRGATDVEIQIVDGSPADCILQAAEFEQADMIIMGSRGLGKLGGLLMGSVSHKVSHLSTCTCVTVK